MVTRHALVILLSVFLAAPSGAALAQVGCLSQAETAAMVRGGQVMPYETAVPRAMRDSGFLGVRLCRDNGILVYVVSTIGGDGRVTHTAVDASSGRVVGKR